MSLPNVDTLTLGSHSLFPLCHVLIMQDNPPPHIKPSSFIFKKKRNQISSYSLFISISLLSLSLTLGRTPPTIFVSSSLFFTSSVHGSRTFDL